MTTQKNHFPAEEEPVALGAAQLFQLMEEKGAFELLPYESPLDLDDPAHFTKLELSSAQKIHISALLQQVPLAMTAGTIAQAYTVRFPQGLPHTLTALQQGGFGSMIRENGAFAGSASFYPMATQAALLGAFSALSIATGQYFLTQIHRELKMLHRKLDKMLDFLHGDKKAELTAEIQFAKYAYHNYRSIMAHESQRIATLTSLQEAKKVAMKDMEFYMGNLEATVPSEAKTYRALTSLTAAAFQMRNSLMLSTQLYLMSGLLEVSYAQNYDAAYLQNLERTANSYLDQCDHCILHSFRALHQRTSDYKPRLLENVDNASCENRIEEVIHSLESGEESALRNTLRSALHGAAQETEYYLSQDGNLYVKAL